MSTTAIKSPVLEWPLRAKVETKDGFRRRIWRSRCGQFKVVESTCLLGPRRGEQAVPVKIRAIRLDEFGDDIISEHKIVRCAQEQCERVAKAEMQ